MMVKTRPTCSGVDQSRAFRCPRPPHSYHEAACEIFRTSTDIVPLETIADKAGVGIATLYRNFPDRTALIHACAAYMFDKSD